MSFKSIKKKCGLKMEIEGNIECGERRLLISGLDGCLCREDNCFKCHKKVRTAPPKEDGGLFTLWFMN